MHKVFISSTGLDLKEYREVAFAVCLRFDLQPMGMEYFEAMEVGATEGSLRKLDNANLYIGIFAHRYGYIEEGYDKSVTELEFDHAGHMGIGRICFVADPEYPWPPEHIDHENYSRLKDFKNSISKLIRAEFTSIDDFNAKLTHAVSEWRQRNPIEQVEGSLLRPPRIKNAPPDFTGREKLLSTLRTDISANNKTRLLVYGMGGIGKTVIVQKLIEDLREDYPDGQIQINLRGFDEGAPITPDEAMRRIISFYYPQIDMPRASDRLQSLYESTLQARRLILFLDNAIDEDQVNPLAPNPENLMVITSRHLFTIPGLTAVEIHKLDTKNSINLLRKIAPRIEDHAETIAELCDYHPLAMRVVASSIAIHKDIRVDSYIEQLENTETRLDILEEVEASIRLSYDLLDPTFQKYWSMLAIFPESFDVAAASDMFELDEKAAQNVLSELVRRSLVEWNELTNRYSLHDLLRVFARSVLSIASLSSGKMRHSNYYLNTLGKFNEIYKKGGETQLEGIHIFDKELENIKAGQNWAANHMDINPAAVQNAMLYPHAGAYLIQMRLGEEDQLQWHEAGLSAARILQNKYYEAASLDSLGTIYLKRDDAKTALSYLKPALDISREMNNEQGAAASLNNIGSAYAIKKDYKQAIIFHKDSLRIVRKKIHESNPNYKIIEGHALHNIGNAYWEQNQYKDSLEYYQRAYMVKNTNGDLLGANTTLVSIASNLYRLGNKPKAIEKISQAIRVLGTANHPILDVAKELLKEWTQK